MSYLIFLFVPLSPFSLPYLCLYPFISLSLNRFVILRSSVFVPAVLRPSFFTNHLFHNLSCSLPFSPYSSDTFPLSLSFNPVFLLHVLFTLFLLPSSGFHPPVLRLTKGFIQKQLQKEVWKCVIILLLNN